jgi:Asp-tRNA(Asn)/Glu-tRNA(Gln) amidotransferase A subunit family amidase
MRDSARHFGPADFKSRIVNVRIATLMLPFLLLARFLAAAGTETSTNPITGATITEGETLLGLEFTPAKREMMIDGLRNQRKKFEIIRQTALPASAVPAILFNPIPIGMKLETVRRKCRWSRPPKTPAPADLEQAAFYSLGQLSALIKSRKITSVQLTRMYLGRLKKYGPRLECVVTLTEDLALEQARRADREIAAGKYRGPLHGIPYGVKDLLATKGAKTTWGSAAFKDQVINENATVVQRLEEAGAVLVAKLSMGELAMGDVWFGGKTRNPWNIQQGSDGSSAGPASATAAGLVAFSIGSETLGSIVSPCTVCGVTGLRPSYGRISRAGAMTLSWTMDKIGPICRTVEDCALVFNAIQGPDGIDQTLCDAPFNYQPKVNLSKLRIGYLKKDFASEKDNANSLAALAKLQALGANLIPVSLPKFPPQITLVLRAEAAAAFDDLTRQGRDDLLVQQDADAWPNVFRAARFIPAVEYLRAQRIRFMLIQDMARTMNDIDVYVAPSEADENLRLTNLTGHPCVVLPDGFSRKGMPTSICFVEKLFGEAQMLAVAKAYQDATGFQLRHPPLAE